ncbi:CHAD domain-containing protein, partial [Pseudomonas aeruginosa]
RVRKRLRRQWKTLRAELADTTYEHWHPLRLRIKRVRYGLEAYPHDCSIPGSRWHRNSHCSRSCQSPSADSPALSGASSEP